MIAVTVKASAGPGFMKAPTGEQLLEIARRISLDALREKAIDYGAGDDIDEYLGGYRCIPSDDLTIRLREDGSVQQCASGGGQTRRVKEILRRAMAVLIADQAHREGYSVDITVF